MKKYILLFFSLLGIGMLNSVNAQTYIDLLRYSRLNYSTTARSMGVGNAMGALGADFSATSFNPAGLGIYRKNEIMGTLGFARPSTSATYLGYETSDDRYNMNIPNFGLVLSDVQTSLGSPKSEGLVAINYGFGMNRINSFSQKTTIEGINTSSSIIDSWVELADGRDKSDLNADEFTPASLAYLAYAINPENNSTTKYWGVNELEPKSFKFLQADEIYTRGNQNDINFNIAANYNNNLFIGGGLSISTLRYGMERTFTETNKTDSIYNYKSSYYKESLLTKGTGIAISLGLIQKLNDVFRVGFSFKSPTYYSLTDYYSYEVGVSQKLYATSPAKSPEGTYEYSITTPMRVGLSGAAIIGKKGFLSADYEYVNYSAARINSVYEGARFENKNTSLYLQSGHNIRVGGELKTEVLSFRAGYNLSTAPMKSQFVSNNADGLQMGYSFGIGMRFEQVFVDIAYQRIQSAYYYQPYTLKSDKGNLLGSTISDYRNNVLVTVGTKF